MTGMGLFSWIEKGIGEEGRSRKLCSSMLRVRMLKIQSKEVHHKKILNLEKGITLGPVWAEFNETFREIMSRKM